MIPGTGVGVWVKARSFLLAGILLWTSFVTACITPNSTSEGDRDDGRPAASCSERVASSEVAIDAVRLQHLACEEATECALVDASTLCRGGCPVAVAVSGLDVMRRAISDANAGLCRTFTTDGCPFATPGCIAVVAACVNGLCTAVPSD